MLWQRAASNRPQTESMPISNNSPASGTVSQSTGECFPVDGRPASSTGGHGPLGYQGNLGEIRLYECNSNWGVTWWLGFAGWVCTGSRGSCKMLRQRAASSWPQQGLVPTSNSCPPCTVEASWNTDGQHVKRSSFPTSNHRSNHCFPSHR